MDAIQTLIVGIINIINQVLGVILVIYSAIIGTFFGGISVAVTADDDISSGCLIFMCVAMVMTVVLYMLLITLGVLGSAMVMMGHACLKRASVVLLLVSEVLMMFVIGLNIICYNILWNLHGFSRERTLLLLVFSYPELCCC